MSLHGERAWYLSYENTSRLLGMMYYGAYAREKEDLRLQRMILFTSAIISTGKTGALLCPISRKACAGKKSQIPLFTEQDSVWRRKKNIKINRNRPRAIVVLLGRQEAEKDAIMAPVAALQDHHEA